ncbi:MAG: hypothetical protein KDA41_02260 [Planctomycetales bacterium]|nr:hypothetical protein [Planctomycetales bacterium]
MGIELRPSGFREWHDHVRGIPAVGVETDRIDDCLAHYRQQGFRGLFGSPSFGFKQDNLDFLAGATNAKWLWFWDVSLRNIDPIYDLTEVEYLGVNPKRPGIDFSRLTTLRTVVNFWVKADTGIAASSITEYYLWHFKPASKTFAGLEIPSGVEHLELNWANPATLEGLPEMKKLKELQFHRCRNLQDLSALPRIAPNLRRLLTTTSSKIDATNGVVDHPKLKEALIDGTFVVGKCE